MPLHSIDNYTSTKNTRKTRYNILLTLELKQFPNTQQSSIHQDLEDRGWIKVASISNAWLVTKIATHRNYAVRECIVDLQNCKDLLGLSFPLPWAAQAAAEGLKEGQV